MKKKWILMLLVIATTMLSSCSYNSMVEMDENVTAQWAQVENAYQRRADLIPNIVSTVKGYAAHEQETLTGVIEARAKATSININANDLTADNLAQFQTAQDGLSQALSKLMVSVERYPELKANENFLDLQAQLEGTENRIAVERRKFNEAAQAYNTIIRKFPKNITAMIFGFDKRDYFKAQQGAGTAPKVEF